MIKPSMINKLRFESVLAERDLTKLGLGLILECRNILDIMNVKGGKPGPSHKTNFLVQPTDVLRNSGMNPKIVRLCFNSGDEAAEFSQYSKKHAAKTLPIYIYQGSINGDLAPYLLLIKDKTVAEKLSNNITKDPISPISQDGLLLNHIDVITEIAKKLDELWNGLPKSE